MRRPTLLALTIVFSVLGIADSWYLTEHALTDTALSCGIKSGALSGCNTVAQSAYSHVFGVPLAIYGLVFYALALLVTLSLYVRESRRRAQGLFMLGIIGLLLSIYFEAIQVFAIKALCIYCLGSFALSIGIFVTSLSLVSRRPAAPPLM